MRSAVVGIMVLLVGCDAEQNLKIGDPCSKDSDCESGRCDKQICKSSAPIDNEKPCEHQYDCFSEVCSKGVCLQGSKKQGETCSVWQQCVTAKCKAGHCVEEVLGDGGFDTAVLDMAVTDMAIDLGTVDLGVDAPTDAAPDIQRPDTLSPDILPPDLLQPDLTPIPGKWVLIPPVSVVAKMPVTFKMGSPGSEPCRNAGNETQHDVTLTRRFEIMEAEVTQKMFQDLMGYNLSNNKSCGDTCPVEMVSWYEAAAYCNKLSSFRGLEQCYELVSGSNQTVVYKVKAIYDGSGAKTIYDCLGFRMPTEAEWEYAYRAGSTTAFYPSTGNDGTITNCTSADANADKIGWYTSNSSNKIHAAKGKASNAWGLFDMAGNVWELCNDWWQSDLGSNPFTDPWGKQTGTYRVLRGSAYHNPTISLRAASRSYYTPTAQRSNNGFRAARTIP